MKNLIYIGLLICFSLQTTFAQFGVFNLDTLLKRHPHRKVIDQQVKKQAASFDQTFKEMADTFYKELRTDFGFICYTPNASEKRKEMKNYNNYRNVCFFTRIAQ